METTKIKVKVGSTIKINGTAKLVKVESHRQGNEPVEQLAVFEVEGDVETVAPGKPAA